MSAVIFVLDIDDVLFFGSRFLGFPQTFPLRDETNHCQAPHSVAPALTEIHKALACARKSVVTDAPSI
jgi:hypothetical protein